MARCNKEDLQGRRCTHGLGHSGLHDSFEDPRQVMREDAATAEMVNHPQHYGGDTLYEHWKVMVAWGLLSNAFLYNCTKYICRAGKKGSALEDLRKAKWYLEKAIEDAETR